MDNRPESAEGEDHEARMWNAIAAFEQILEAMPEDRAALETLTEAYESIGDRARAIEYLLRLARVVISERDSDEAGSILDRIDRLGDGSPALEEVRTALEQLNARKQPAETESGPPVRSGFDVTEEVTLAWRLLQDKQISNEEYTQIVHDLSDNRIRQLDTPVSVLHVLEDRQSKNTLKVLAYMAQKSGLPVLDLSRFELRAEDLQQLPLELSTNRGALAFGRIDDEPMVIVLNPFDGELRLQVQTALQKRVHFFLASAPSYDQALESRRKLEAAKE